MILPTLQKCFIPKIIAIFFFLIFFNQVLYAQNSINASGGIATGTGGTVSFSIGQIFYIAYQQNGISVTEGVQQPFNIHSGIDSKNNTQCDISIFPNPTRGELYINIPNFVTDKIVFSVYDIRGSLIKSGELTEGVNRYNIAFLPSGNYIVNVFDNKKTRKFSQIIIKN